MRAHLLFCRLGIGLVVHPGDPYRLGANARRPPQKGLRVFVILGHTDSTPQVDWHAKPALNAEISREFTSHVNFTGLEPEIYTASY